VVAEQTNLPFLPLSAILIEIILGFYQSPHADAGIVP
jgi:hypothetical protein